MTTPAIPDEVMRQIRRTAIGLQNRNLTRDPLNEADLIFSATQAYRLALESVVGLQAPQVGGHDPVAAGDCRTIPPGHESDEEAAEKYARVFCEPIYSRAEQHRAVRGFLAGCAHARRSAPIPAEFMECFEDMQRALGLYAEEGAFSVTPRGRDWPIEGPALQDSGKCARASLDRANALLAKYAKKEEK